MNFKLSVGGVHKGPDNWDPVRVKCLGVNGKVILLSLWFYRSFVQWPVCVCSNKLVMTK